MGPLGKTARLLFPAAAILGGASALLQSYALFSAESFTPLRATSFYVVATWASMVVAYVVTPAVFYLLGRRGIPGFRVSVGLVAVYLGAFLGEASGQTLFSLLFKSVLIPIPFIYLTDFQLSLSFLLVAFSGISMARLRQGGPGTGRTVAWFPLVALAFALPPNFLEGLLQLGTSGLDILSFGVLFTVTSLLSLPAQFLVFYYIGRRVDVRGRALGAFGWLFLGTYVGAIVGAALAVGLSGQSQWGTLPGYSGTLDGIVYSNLPAPLVALLMSLNPVGSLPFLSFFAVTLPQVGREPRKSAEPASGPEEAADATPLSSPEVNTS